MKKMVFIMGIFALFMSCDSANEQKNKEWQQRMEQEGQQLQKDVDHAIGKDDAVYSIKNGDDN